MIDFAVSKLIFTYERQKMRTLTADEKKKYEEMVAQAEQLKFDMEQLLNGPVIYGYARVSSRTQARDGNSLESQKTQIIANGASEEHIFTDTYTGTSPKRPALDQLLQEVKQGDTIIVTKLDRLARSVQQGVKLITELHDKGIKIHVLNMGILDNSPNGKLMMNMLLAFAEFERDLIMQRTQEGKEIARQNPGYREGRKPKYSEAQIKHALSLLNDHSYTQVSNLTGISKSTLIRANKKLIGGGLT